MEKMKLLDKKQNLNNAVLYFNDDACSICYTEKNVVAELDQQIGDKLPIFEVTSDLTDKFGVSSMPSVVLIKDGQKVDQFNKYLDIDQIKTVIHYYFGGMLNGK